MSRSENALILLYHRVTTIERDPQMLCVSPENFRQQMDVLRRRGLKLMPLKDLVDSIESNRVPSGAVAITFDDGYADNLEQAAPILRKYEAPATVFATNAYTNCDAEFYWDDLDRIFLSPGSLPRYLRLWMADSAVEVDLEHFDYYPHSTARASQEWTILDENDPTPRHTAYREV
ncbi:MAG TPA: polysaccharide deacetylase family protein, partial [Chloroflexota bacterium]|nr:polysaccharide deacetylase family protein [Chloroflexota bacterium]